MNISQRCLDGIKHHEGVRQKPYRDSVYLWTVGVGHLMYDSQAKLRYALHLNASCQCFASTDS